MSNPHGTYESTPGSEPASGTWKTSVEPGGPPPVVHIKGPTRGAVILFIIAIVSAMGLVFAGTSFAVYVANSNTARIQHAAEQIALSRQYQHALCDAGNVARAQQVQLWQYIITISPAKTAEQKRRIADFEVYLHHIFMPRDCNHP